MLTGMLAVIVSAAGAAEKPTEPSKKGWAGGQVEAARSLNCSWFYNWGFRGDSSEGFEFVPMIKTKDMARDKVLEEVKTSGATHLLGFNEPERESQGNTTLEEALDLWPKLMATGLRLGSPAPSSDQAGMDWLEAFMKEVEKRNLRVDFMSVHYYRTADVVKFKMWLDDLYRRYRRPIWVTEYNAKFTKSDRDRFARDASKMLEKHKHVERFAYMDGFTNEPGAFFEDPDRTRPTKLGEFFRDL